jgi:hypothetical protein
MRTFFFTLLLVLAAASILAGPALADEAAERKAAEEAAVESALAWLKLVDQGEYGLSWEQAAELFKKAVNRERWNQTCEGVIKPLGKLLSRKLKSAKYAENLPGAPDGRYVVIQFETVLENKKSAVETVTPMEDPDGVWRVSGYYIK